MANIEKLKAMRIVVDNVVWFPLIKDDGIDEPTYGESVSLPGVMVMNINPNSSVSTAFFDDGPGEIATTLGNIEVNFTKSTLSPQDRSILLGKAYSNDGILINSKNDIPPYGALLFRTLKSDGSYKYVCLYKGKFIDPSDNNETKGETINFQSDEIVGRFVKLSAEFELTDTTTSTTPVDKTVIVKPWKMEIDSSDILGELAPTIWFSKVPLPNVDLTPKQFALENNDGYIIWSQDETIDGTVKTVTYVASIRKKEPVTTKVTLSKHVDATTQKVTYSISGEDSDKYWTFKDGDWSAVTEVKQEETIPDILPDLEFYYSTVQVEMDGNIVMEVKCIPGIECAKNPVSRIVAKKGVVK